MSYVTQLEKEKKAKEKELQKLIESRHDQTYRENFYHVESGINSMTVDIATLQSRIDNYGKKGINLPDHDNVITINKYK